MGLDQTTLGLLSPGVAVAGDLAVALVIAYAVVVPLKLAVRKATRRLERRAWQWSLEFAPAGRAAGWWHRAVQWWLESRLRFAIRLRLARYSLPQALGRGLQIGVPLAAIIVATIPVFGISWYFDTENWAAGIWNSWAESRTDIWRAAMVKAVVADGRAREDASGFEVHPAGVGDGPFSFIVIGDTGEGDASQHVLRDQLIKAADQEDVRFVVISSDVVYPTGRDERLRVAVLAAVQGGDQAGLCHTREPRLVRRARGVHRDVLRTASRARGDARAHRSGQPAHGHDR